VGKGVPPDHWESIAENGLQLVYGSTANLFLGRHTTYRQLGRKINSFLKTVVSNHLAPRELIGQQIFEGEK
jgi:hypothetical protein